MLGVTSEKQKSLCVFPRASPVLFCTGGAGGALVIPVEGERNLHGDENSHFPSDPRRAGSRRLGSI